MGLLLQKCQAVHSGVKVTMIMRIREGEVGDSMLVMKGMGDEVGGVGCVVWVDGSGALRRSRGVMAYVDGHRLADVPGPPPYVI